MRDKARRSVVYVRGVENIPTLEKAGTLLESYGAPYRRCPTLRSARYTSYRSRRC